jgi:DNA-binding IclR family transcriptional regulator
MVAAVDHAEVPNEEVILRHLRARGECLLEELPRLTGLDWATVFAIVDHLNRAGLVVLKKERWDYRVIMERRP